MTCKQCNLENAKRISRAYYACPDCGRDVSLEWFLYMQANGKAEASIPEFPDNWRRV